MEMENVTPPLQKNRELNQKVRQLSEAEIHQLAHLPLLTVFYLAFQRHTSPTPVTALELSAYLGIDVQVVEALLEYLDKQGLVRVFRKDIAAYSLIKDLHEINMRDLLEILSQYRDLLKTTKVSMRPNERIASDEKYRKIYSDLASEILQLFGQESANQLPV